MTFKHRFAIPVLVSACCGVACSQGSGASNDYTGPGPEPSFSGAGQVAGSTAAGASAGAPGATGGTGAGGGDVAVGGTDTDTGSGGAGNTGNESMAGGESGGAAPQAGAGGMGTAGMMGMSGAAGSTMGTAGMNSGAGVWGTPVAGGPKAGGTMISTTVTVNRTTTKGNVPAGFAGFSVEKTHMTNSTFTGANTNLIGLYKLIGPTTLRIGANDVDRCRWTPATPNGKGGPPYGFDIGTAMVDSLGEFVTASGAKLIYGVNFYSNNVPNTVAEATYASTKLGSSIIGFELGNEVNKYDTWANQKTKWESFATGIAGAVPSAKFIGPACTSGGASSFTAPFAADESTKLGAKLVELSHHYYNAGAGSTSATVATLQTLKADINTISATMNDSTTKNKITGWRMDEANTFSGHGQMGVSDTLIGGLWAIDFMFQIALNGGSGVNFHGGETGMDGTKPFYYMPIMESNGAVTAVMPVYYGMLFFYLAGQGPVLATTVTGGNANFNAYAVDYKADGSTSVMLVNRSGTTGVQATVNVGSAVTSASAIYMQGTPAGSLTASVGNVTAAGATVSTAGAWSRAAPFTQTTTGTTVSVFVPPASAALVRVK